jgi:hypothetical protein
LYIRVDAPEPGQLVVNPEASVRVSGLASTLLTDEKFDVVIVVDRSQSTAFSAEEDVDLDGVVSRSHSNDSIYMAEHIAARLFSQSMTELNGDPVHGARIRLGLVSFAGEYRPGNSFRRLQRVRKVKLDPVLVDENIARNARLESPLSGNFRELHHELARTALYQRSGRLGTYTDFIAGLGRAAEELDANGRPGARRVILFMTDGDPTLPVNPQVADVLSRQYARDLAARDIVVNTFGIGPRVREERTLEVIASETGGTYSRVRSPAKIMRTIRQRSISAVRSGAVVNWAPTCDAPRALARSDRPTNAVFNLDGSFSADVPLRPGPNCIAIVIEVSSGERYEHMIPVEFRYPEGYVEGVREDLTVGMQEVRAGRRERLERQVQVRVERRKSSPLPILEDVAAPPRD